MQITDGKELCVICNNKLSVIYCDGCEKPLCKDCRTFDLWAYGCGHINPKAFCNKCLNDLEINPWGGERKK